MGSQAGISEARATSATSATSAAREGPRPLDETPSEPRNRDADSKGCWLLSMTRDTRAWRRRHTDRGQAGARPSRGSDPGGRDRSRAGRGTSEALAGGPCAWPPGAAGPRANATGIQPNPPVHGSPRATDSPGGQGAPKRRPMSPRTPPRWWRGGRGRSPGTRGGRPVFTVGDQVRATAIPDRLGTPP